MYHFRIITNYIIIIISIISKQFIHKKKNYYRIIYIVCFYFLIGMVYITYIDIYRHTNVSTFFGVKEWICSHIVQRAKKYSPSHVSIRMGKNWKVNKRTSLLHYLSDHKFQTVHWYSRRKRGRRAKNEIEKQKKR